MKTRKERLCELMTQHKLTAREVGKMLNRSRHTVLCWRSKWEDREIPAHTLELLEIKLAGRATS